MKAWTCHNEMSGYSTVVFAETRGKAKSAALNTYLMGDDYSFTEIRVFRCPQMDAMYKGESEVDWYDPDTKMALVKELGWYCEEPLDEECESCPALEWCDVGKEGLADE